MVLESLISPITAEKKPWEMFFIGILFSSVAIFLSIWIFEQYASLIMVFFIVMACTPLVFSALTIEEKKDLEEIGEKKLLEEHAKLIFFLLMLFLGVAFSIAMWYILLPQPMSDNLFNIQKNTITEINNQVTMKAISNSTLFSKIFFNNMRVLIIALFFAFIYGFGSLFILIWNASVIGVALGAFIKSKIAEIAATAGYLKITAYLSTTSHGLLRYFTHGVFEIGAYFIAGLAGSIISIAIINHDFKTKKFEKILFDSVNLLIISILLLVFAAFLETFVTPFLF